MDFVFIEKMLLTVKNVEPKSESKWRSNLIMENQACESHILDTDHFLI